MNKLGRIAVVGCALLFAAFSLNAQAKTEKNQGTGEKTFKGFLADKMCGTGFTKSGDAKKATEKAKKHTKDCALEENCRASGYGLVIGAKFLKFNDAGDKLAFDYLNKTKRENNLYVQVKGTMDGDIINVASLKDAK
ncbi:MAG: hypothetical protein ABSE41_11710 [Bacteroidota bacterium]|jgi:hypothetical protein